MPVIKSLLDTDLYKLTMQAVVVGKYSDAHVEYLFTNRSTDKHLTKEAAEWIREEINSLETLRFEPDEIAFLAKSVGFLPKSYLQYLETCRLDPRREVSVEFESDLVIKVSGLWRDTILYEIPILAIVSEAYFKFIDSNWDYTGQIDLAKSKATTLAESGCMFSEFGTRRRRSFEAQKNVLAGIMAANCGSNLIGTSNVYFAKLYNLKPIGTVAHELMMGIAAFHQDYRHANRIAMDAWLETVGLNNAGFALTDTFGTPNFLEVFAKPYTDYYRGVRQDSGDPIEYTNMISKHYSDLGYEPNTKHILYSDSLNIELCRKYKAAAEAVGLLPSFGVGTFFTNDFETLDGKPSKPLNIVMKIHAVNGKPCVKLSDNIGKNMGDKDAITQAKKEVGYSDSPDAVDEKQRW